MTTASAVLFFVCLVAGEGAIDAVDAFKRRSKYGLHDSLSMARCEASCWLKKNNRNICIKTCLVKGFVKPGCCPTHNTTLSPFDAVCLEACHQDTECPALEKCCRHRCGMTCQNPEELLSAVGVPTIPSDVRATEGNRRRTIIIKWKVDSGYNTNSTVLYLIEERHYLGKNFIEERLTEWTPCGRSIKTRYVLRNFVKPGRWYQFRVAAVNENGTNGFSSNSPIFSISASPKPPKAPANVTVGPFWIVNGTLYAEIRWLPPHSDLPIQKYKIFWSRRLYGAEALESALVHHQVVSKDSTKFLLENLQPNSTYFLQVQALVQFGRNRIEGEKSGYLLNTSSYINEMARNSSSKIEDLRLLKLYWYQGELRARIVWKPITESVRYTVNWKIRSCGRNLKSYNNFKLAATTYVPHFDIHELHFSCRYRVDVGTNSIQDTFITFVTPSCNKFKESHKKIRCSV